MSTTFSAFENRSTKHAHLAAWLLLTLLALFVFGWRLGAIHLFDLDEALYVSCSRQMILTGDFITPRLNTVAPDSPTNHSSELTTPFFEKPIGVYWAAAGAMRLFGMSEGVVRLPVVLTALLTLALVCVYGKKWFGHRAGFLAGLCFLTAPLTAIDSRQMTTDGLLLLWLSVMIFSYASLVGIGGITGQKSLCWLGFWGCGALAVLTKGIVGLIFPALIIFCFGVATARSEGERKLVPLVKHGLAGFRPLIPIPGILLVILLTAPWHFAIAARHERDSQGRDFVQEYVIRQHIGRFKGGDKVHNAPLPSYFAFLLIGFFPWACFLPAALSHTKTQKDEDAPVGATQALPSQFVLPNAQHPTPNAPLHRYLTIWVGVIFVFFSLASAKLPTYIAPLYPAASLLVGTWLDGALTTGKRDRSLVRGAFVAMLTAGVLVVAVLVAPNYVPKNAPVPPEIVTLALHLTGTLLMGSIVGWLCFLTKRRIAGVVALASAMVLLIGIISEEGYPLAQRTILSPYQDAAAAANTLRTPGEPVIFYHIIPRRPSMLFYSDYSPIERKETPLSPLLDTVLTKKTPTALVILSRNSFEKELSAELKTQPTLRVQSQTTKGDWLVLRLSRD